MVFVSGKIGLAKDGTQPGDTHSEMRQAMQNFGDCLDAAGCTFDNGKIMGMKRDLVVKGVPVGFEM